MQSEEQKLVQFATWGYFTFSILHNLANQLTQLQCLLEEVKPSLPPSHRDLVANTTSYLCNVVRDSQAALQRQPSCELFFSVNEIFERLSLLLAWQVQTKKIAFSIRCTRSLYLYGNQTVFQQIMLNLLQNALEAVYDQPPGRRRLQLQARKYQKFLIITVTDTGVGFSRSKKLGHGLGLAYVRHHLEHDFQGSLRIRSKFGETTVRLQLPLPLSIKSSPQPNAEQQYRQPKRSVDHNPDQG